MFRCSTFQFAAGSLPRRLLRRRQTFGMLGGPAADVQRLPPPGQARWAADVTPPKPGDVSGGRLTSRLQNLEMCPGGG
jgi:hypothetical protein